MRICVISPLIGPELVKAGHEVVSFWPNEPLFDLPAALAEKKFIPDLIFQRESLTQRVLLSGLRQFSCPKIFWSLDTHSNLHWQRSYFRLFDGILTPHAAFCRRDLETMPQAFRRMAIFAPERPWVPFADRKHDVAFVGRITEHRPLRLWLAEFLQTGYAAVVAKDMSVAEMLDLYGTSRLAPNESMMREVNFRLVEAAGCGCLVFSQDVGPDQDELFAAGKEIETYDHVLELKALLDHYVTRPEQAERLARAAWERVQREHLLRHRCETVLSFAEGLPTASASGQEADAASVLTLLHLGRAGMLTIPWESLARELDTLSATPELTAARLMLLVENGPRDAARALLHRMLAEGLHAADLDANLAGSMAGMRIDDLQMAKQFWFRHVSAGPGQAQAMPATPVALLLAWAKELAAVGRVGSLGLEFDPERHLPRAAIECLHLAKSLAPDDLEVSRRLLSLTEHLPGYEFLRLGQLSLQALHAPKDWRTGLRLGLANLSAYRMQAGLEDILHARETAAAQGKADAFLRALAGMDPKGSVFAALTRLDVAS